MANIPLFEDFIPMGFGMDQGVSWALSGSRSPGTGYNMTAFGGPLEDTYKNAANEAHMYEKNDNPDHTAEGYLMEAKKHIGENLDKAYESHCQSQKEDDGIPQTDIDYVTVVDEAMVQVAGKDKPSGAKVLSSVIVDHLIDKKIVTRAYKKKLETEIQDIIINSTF